MRHTEWRTFCAPVYFFFFFLASTVNWTRIVQDSVGCKRTYTKRHSFPYTFCRRRLDVSDVTAKCGVFFAACANGPVEMKYTPSAWHRHMQQLTLVESQYCYIVDVKISRFGDFIYNCIFLSCSRLLWVQLLTFCPSRLIHAVCWSQVPITFRRKYLRRGIVICCCSLAVRFMYSYGIA